MQQVLGLHWGAMAATETTKKSNRPAVEFGSADRWRHNAWTSLDGHLNGGHLKCGQSIFKASACNHIEYMFSD